jgi:hypothetical protein
LAERQTTVHEVLAAVLHLVALSRQALSRASSRPILMAICLWPVP